MINIDYVKARNKLKARANAELKKHIAIEEKQTKEEKDRMSYTSHHQIYQKYVKS